MTLADCISRVDNQLPNTYAMEEKIAWLAHLDGKIFNNIVSRHLTENEAGELLTPIGFKPYGIDSMTEELIAPFPYDEMYVSYVKAQIHLLNEETYRYNNEVTVFNELYDDFAKAYNREHPWSKDVQIKLW